MQHTFRSYPIWNGSNQNCRRNRADTGCGTDRWTDRVKPIYPRTTSLCKGYNELSVTARASVSWWYHLNPEQCQLGIRSHAINWHRKLNNSWTLLSQCLGSSDIQQDIIDMANIPVEWFNASIPVEWFNASIPVERFKASIPVERFKANIPVEWFKANIPVEWFKASIPVELFKANIPVEWLKANIPVEWFKANIPVEWFKANIPVEWFKAIIPVEWFKANIPVEWFKANIPVEWFKANIPVEWLNANIPVEWFKANIPVEWFKANIPVEWFKANIPVEWFKVKTYRDYHYKKVMRPSYLYNRNSYTGKTITLYWISLHAHWALIGLGQSQQGFYFSSFFICLHQWNIFNYHKKNSFCTISAETVKIHILFLKSRFWWFLFTFYNHDMLSQFRD